MIIYQPIISNQNPNADILNITFHTFNLDVPIVDKVDKDGYFELESIWNDNGSWDDNSDWID